MNLEKKMNRLLILMLLTISAVWVGCSRPPEVVDTSLKDKPLTVEEWKQLDVDVKYEFETFERLKIAEPDLNDEEKWDEFMREVIVPARKKDILSS